MGILAWRTLAAVRVGSAYISTFGPLRGALILSWAHDILISPSKKAVNAECGSVAFCQWPRSTLCHVNATVCLAYRKRRLRCRWEGHRASLVNDGLRDVAQSEWSRTAGIFLVGDLRGFMNSRLEQQVKVNNC